MDRLNYFNAYLSKKATHEDQLTRAYLVLLKYSQQAFSAFYSYCLEQHGSPGSPDEVGNLPYYHHLVSLDVDLKTQNSAYTFKTSKLLSVVISDRELDYTNLKIKKDSRKARYDGVIEIGDELSIIIENKPNVEHVWKGQLNPSESNFGEEETEVLRDFASLEWKKIVKHLNKIISDPRSISREENILIDDFLSYIDQEFPILNPYDNFELCKNSETLIKRRIKKLLENIAGEEFEVREQRGWGYEIELGYDEIRMAGLLCDMEGSDWQLKLALYFGLGVEQGRKFYNHDIDLNKPRKAGFELSTHFKFGFITDGIISAFPSTDVEHYVDYWRSHQNEIRQIKRNEVKDYLKKLSQSAVVKITQEKREELEKNFWDTERQTLNPNPSVEFIYTIDSDQAIKWDNAGLFEEKIKEKLIEALSIISKSPSAFLK